jgi:serine/threonine-protein kinase
VLDFGVSKILSSGNQEARQETKTGSILGSPGYVPPEQWFSSKTTDKRSDIWALGLVLYEFLTGRLPFVEASIPVLATKIAYEPAVPPRRLREEIPADLEQVVLRCLEKRPDDRFQDVTALAKALEACQRSYQALGSSSANRSIRLKLPGVDRLRRSFPLSMRAAGVALIALLLVVGLGAVLYRRGSLAAGPRQSPASQASQPTPPPVPLVFPAPSAGAPSAAAAPSPSSAPVARPKIGSAQRHSTRKADTDASRCHPPYYFNAKGIRVFKIQCL